MSSSTRPHESLQEWPVLVFRRTIAKGWERFHHPKPDSSSENANQEDTITAAPRKGCVEVRKLRLRIHLFQQSGTGTSGGKKSQKATDASISSNSNANGNGAGGVGGNTLVVRRIDTILLSTRRGVGAVVLKFRNRTECLAFSDRLLELNAEEAAQNRQLQDDSIRSLQSTDINPLLRRGIEHRPQKRRRMIESQDSATSGDSGSTHIVTLTGKKEADSTEQMSDFERRRRQDVLSYMVRLLHDEGFLGFVNEIEDSLASAPDCAGILAALGQRR